MTGGIGDGGGGIVTPCLWETIAESFECFWYRCHLLVCLLTNRHELTEKLELS